MPATKPRARKPAARLKGRQARAAKAPPPGAGAKAVEARIRAAGGWQAKTLAEVRRLIRETDSEVVEEVKWVKPSNPLGVVAWSHDGLLCTGETYKDKVKLTFARGADLEDPHGLFNAGFGGGTRRAIDLREGDRLDPASFKALLRAALDANAAARAR